MTLPQAIRWLGGIRSHRTETLTGELRALRRECGLLHLFNQKTGLCLDLLARRLQEMGWQEIDGPDALLESLRDHALHRAISKNH